MKIIRAGYTQFLYWPARMTRNGPHTNTNHVEWSIHARSAFACTTPMKSAFTHTTHAESCLYPHNARKSVFTCTTVLKSNLISTNHRIQVLPAQPCWKRPWSAQTRQNPAFTHTTLLKPENDGKSIYRLGLLWGLNM